VRELDKSATKTISPDPPRSQSYIYPSLSRGRISVTLIGTESGIARLTSVKGSKELRVWLLNRRSRSGRSRSACHGNRRSQVSFKGKMSRANKLQQMVRLAYTSLSKNRMASFVVALICPVWFSPVSVLSLRIPLTILPLQPLLGIFAVL
jgi:hypothetical protein